MHSASIVGKIGKAAGMKEADQVEQASKSKKKRSHSTKQDEDEEEAEKQMGYF